MVVWVLNEESEWTPIELSGEIQIGRSNDGLLAFSQKVDHPAALLSPWRDATGKERYVLIGEAGKGEIRVNGVRILGMRVLDHRDEVQIAGPPVRFYFSSDLPARKTRYKGSDARPFHCARCKGEISPGEEVVRCPGCRLLYHEMGGRGCWTYDAVCLGCKRPTGENHLWRPEPIRKMKRRGWGKVGEVNR